MPQFGTLLVKASSGEGIHRYSCVAAPELRKELLSLVLISPTDVICHEKPSTWKPLSEANVHRLHELLKAKGANISWTYFTSSPKTKEEDL